MHEDLKIIDEGSIVVFEWLSYRGERFLLDNLNTEPWQWHGKHPNNLLCVDHRMAPDIVALAEEEGLSVAQ